MPEDTAEYEIRLVVCRNQLGVSCGQRNLLGMELSDGILPAADEIQCLPGFFLDLTSIERVPGGKQFRLFPQVGVGDAGLLYAEKNRRLGLGAFGEIGLEIAMFIEYVVPNGHYERGGEFEFRKLFQERFVLYVLFRDLQRPVIDSWKNVFTLVEQGMWERFLCPI